MKLNILLPSFGIFLTSCFPVLSVVAGDGGDASSAVGHDTATEAAASDCNMRVEAARIMAGQNNVVDCGTIELNDPMARPDELIACVRNAWDTGRPFRGEAFGVGRDIPVRQMILGRQTPGGFQCVYLQWDNANISPSAVRAIPGMGGVYAQTRGQQVFLGCQGPGTNPQVAYDPPMTIPNGTICPNEFPPR